MKKLALLFSIVAGGCMSGASTGSQSSNIMSCFDGSKSGTVDCVPTPEGPETQPMDVDGDGKDDTFVCADRDRDDDGTPDFEDHSDSKDGADDSASDGKGSGSSVGSGSDDGSGSGSASGSDSSDDQDGDGVPDSEDCGNVTPPPPA